MVNTQRKRTLSKVIILAIILIMPGFLYFFLTQKGENRYKPLPILGPKELSGTHHSRRGVQIPDTTFHTIRPFSLLNEDGRLLHFPEDDGISIVNFFYTRCDTFCLAMNQGMNRIAQGFARNEIVNLFSISVDSTDSPERLKEYSKQFNKEYTRWAFLTGKKDEALIISKQDFLLDAVIDTTQRGRFIITPNLVLLDSQQRIRGYYDASDPKGVDLIIDEIKLLITEELRNRRQY